MSFSINCLEITAKKWQWKFRRDLYKNLLSEEDYKGLKDDAPFQKRFFFNDFYNHDLHGVLKKNANRIDSDLFFEKNINVQVIVGNNGAGKSSLMELLYILINNFACIFTHLMPRSNFFVIGLYANLYFSNEFGEFILICSDTKLLLWQRIPVNDIKNVIVECGELDAEKFVEINGTQAQNIAERLFYTIVSNYALLSFVPSSYRTYCAELRKQSEESGKWKLSRFDYEVSWIQRIFHKNDGYICPIVLNPMRNEGTIDVEKEMRLSRYRLMALLIYAKKLNYSFDDRYRLEKIEFYLTDDAIYKLREKWGKLKDAGKDEIVKIVNGWLEDANSVSSKIIGNFGLEISEKSSEIKKIALAYLQSKILSLPKYKSYKNFSEGQIEDLEIRDIDDVKKENLEGLFLQMSQDSSHIVTKIHQTINFLSIKDDDELFRKTRPFNIYDYSEYEDAIIRYIVENKEKLNNLKEDQTNFFNPPFIHAEPWNGDKIDEKWNFSLDEIIENLPPPIFECEIELYDKNDKKIVPYSKMSSGELQLLQTISTHLYHVRNIMSVNGSRLLYKNINMVFDELDMCFHPEYQRLFVKKLIDIIKNLNLNASHSFNIFLITHSPFVLSDIPQNNVLYLKDGRQEERDGETFAGNLGELLSSGFFLSGTIGSFASKKIDELIDHIKKKNISSEDRLLVEKIGDPLLRSFLRRKLLKEVN